tara:strand:+ start:909 stop:2120 length:1212 start_codon:yes stop_codon:yes gene_type:complete
MDMYSLKFINHACIAFENEEELILTDPWFSGKVFNNSWNLLEETSLDDLNLHKLSTIFYSHEHPDHLSWKTLKDIRERVDQDIMIVFKERENKNIMKQCQKLGYDFAEIVPNQETQLRDNFTVGLFPYGTDSALVYRVDGKVILNQNDCHLQQQNIYDIKSIYSHIDVWFMQFGLAGYYANNGDSYGLQNARNEHLQMIEKYYRAFNPDIFVPFASFVYFCKEYNSFLNEVQVTPDDVLKTFPSSNYSTQIMYRGDSVLYKDWEKRNIKNVEKWNSIFENNQIIDELKQCSEDNILESAEQLMNQDFTKSIYDIGPTELHLDLFDSDKAFLLDFSNKKYSFINKKEINNNILAGRLPMEELWSFLKFPWGGDTLNITSCFDKLNSNLWTSMLVYRDSLYTGRD